MKNSMPHPSREELIALTIDELPAPRAEAVREHLLDCEDCLGEVRELLRLPEAPVSPEMEVSDEDQAAAWQRLQQRIAEEDDAPAPPLAPVVPMPAAPRTAAPRTAPVRSRFREWSGLLAAAVLGIAIGASFLRGDGGEGGDSGLRPFTVTTFTEADQALRGTAGSEAKTIKCPPPGYDFGFQMPFNSGVTPAAVKFVITTADGEIVSSAKVEPDEEGVARFTVDRDALPEGRYVLSADKQKAHEAPNIYDFEVSCPP